MNNELESLSATLREMYATDNFIPLHEPSFRGREKELVVDCIESGWVSSVGQYVNQFEELLAQKVGVNYAVATVNGTAALELMLLSLGVGPGDCVLCPDLSFVATAAAICHIGAEPIFIDVENERFGMCPTALQEFLETSTEYRDGQTFLKESNKPIKACLVMHNVGFPVLWDELSRLCRAAGITILEDAAEALGSAYNGQVWGSFGKAGILSFNGNKVMTTGGSGAFVTNDEALAVKARYLATTAKCKHPYRYEHDEIGYNFIMPNINAAMGVAQLETLEETLALKRSQAQHIRERLKELSFAAFLEPDDGYNHWFNAVKLIGATADEVIPLPADLKIMARPIWSSISEMKPYKNFVRGVITNSPRLANTVICLPNGVSPRSLEA